MKVNDIDNFMTELDIKEPANKNDKIISMLKENKKDVEDVKQDKIKSMTFCRRADRW